nr:lipoate--protein ligase family protein [Bifidobacterium myosotis]
MQKRASVNPSQGDSFALFERNAPDTVADSSQGDSPDAAPGQAEGLGHTEGRHPEELSHAEEYRARWESLRRNLVVVHDTPRMPAEQMTIDETWAREVATGERRPTLRLWEWAGPAVVIGRFQSAPDEVNLDVAERYGFDVVRRCTGGGTMFIEPGNTITYSLYAPLDFVRGVSIEESYRLCDWWLVESLRGLGLDVRFAGLNDIASQYGKIGGAAQRRFPVDTGRADAAADADAKGAAEDAGTGFGRGRGHGAGAVLHHVTMAYDIDAAKMGAVLNTSREKMSDKAVKSAVKRVDPLRSQTGLSRETIIDHLLAWFA